MKNVVTRLNELVEMIRTDYLYQQNTKLDENLPIKICDDPSSSNDSFLSSQLLIDCLLRLKPSSNERKELVSFCKDYYQQNHSQLKLIQEFDHTYSPDRALWWFTRYGFISRLLTKALREENFDMLYRFRFLLHDLGWQLGKNHFPSPIHVYRSQLMAKDDVQILKNSVGKFLSINSFLSTSVNAEQSRSVLQAANCSGDFEKVLFDIEADPRLPNSRSFSDIQLLGYSSEIKQILFMIGSIFRICKIKRDDQQIWHVRLVFSSIKDRELKSIFPQMKNELGMGGTNLFQFARLLHRTGKSEQSEKYFRQCLNQLPNDHPHLSSCYQSLAKMAESKKNFPSSLKWHKKALHFYRLSQEAEYGILAEMYSSIGKIYMRMNDCNHAKKFYEKALDNFQKTTPENPSRTISCLNNLGAVYDMKQEYPEALRCYQKALEMDKKYKDPETTRTLRNIANVYELQGQFKQALDYYQKAMKICRNSSSSNSVFIHDIETSIRRVSSEVK